jgi:prevent-host-death family protein
MQVANIHETKTNLSKYLHKVLDGEDLIVAKHGEPIAVIIPWSRYRTPRKLGLMKGKIRMADDFDELPADLLAAFNGESE